MITFDLFIIEMTTRDYDHLFKLLIIGDSGMWAGLITEYLVKKNDSCFQGLGKAHFCYVSPITRFQEVISLP